MAKLEAGWIERASSWAMAWTGSSRAFGLAVAVVVVWVLTGPEFHYSDTWQLVINTGTTVVTFLMVFLIQRAQNKEAVAVQVKLDELIRAVHGARNRMIAAEDLSEEQLLRLKERFEALAHRKRGNRSRQRPR